MCWITSQDLHRDHHQRRHRWLEWTTYGYEDGEVQVSLSMYVMALHSVDLVCLPTPISVQYVTHQLTTSCEVHHVPIRHDHDRLNQQRKWWLGSSHNNNATMHESIKYKKKASTKSGMRWARDQGTRNITKKIQNRTLSWPPTSQTTKFKRLYSTVSTLKPTVGIVVITSPNFNLYKMVV